MEIRHLWVCVLIICCLVETIAAYGAMWWAMGTAFAFDELSPPTIECGHVSGLMSKQQRFCKRNRVLMPSVAEGAHVGITECQWQFRGRRWNCTTVDGDNSVFGKVIEYGSRETAFVNSVLSAGLVHAVTRACSRGDFLNCHCDSYHTGPPNQIESITPNDTWKWGGCSEDVEFGVEFSRDFINPRENRARARGSMNRHNDEAGRQAVVHNMELKCKCHGISGSCEVKTCWWQMKNFRELGNILKTKYDSAAEMRVVRRQDSGAAVESLEPKFDMYKPPTTTDLVYYEQSPNYCDFDPERGTFGTTGRQCNITSHGIDGCELLCCGRGHNTVTVATVERCDCKFVWCCKVICKECARVYDVHTCK